MIVFSNNEFIDFYGIFQPSSVEGAVQFFAREAGLRRESACYFLAYDKQISPHGFVPTGRRFDADGPIDFLLPERIAFERLVKSTWDWNPSTSLECADEQSNASLLPAFSSSGEIRLRWHFRILAQNRGEYVGYFKAGGLDAKYPNPMALIAAAYRTKQHLAGVATRSLVDRYFFVESSYANILKAAKAIEDATDVRQALHHVADLLTSHHGARWNRAACFLPVQVESPNRVLLRCMYAHGGIGQSDWQQVQETVVRQFTNVDGLLRQGKIEPMPPGDPYSYYAAGNRPVEVEITDSPGNNNILAKLWRENGNVVALPDAYWGREEFALLRKLDQSIDTEEINVCHLPIAALLGVDDPWIRVVERSHGRNTVLSARNGEYWVLPWIIRGGKLIGIWIVDLACWSVQRVQGREPPSLVLSRRILSELAEPFEKRFG